MYSTAQTVGAAGTAHRRSRSVSCVNRAKPGPEPAGSRRTVHSRSWSSRPRCEPPPPPSAAPAADLDAPAPHTTADGSTWLRAVTMPGPQTAQTVDPLGEKGAGVIHGHQIMTAPRRHPTQDLAALGALQNLLERPSIPHPHRRDRIQAGRRRVVSQRT